jgi:hypothetical protein
LESVGEYYLTNQQWEEFYGLHCLWVGRGKWLIYRNKNDKEAIEMHCGTKQSLKKRCKQLQ